MGGVWLACCAPEDVPILRAEIRARDRRARIFRLGGTDSVGEMSTAFPEDDASVAIFLHGSEDRSVEESVGEIARTGCVSSILVFVDEAEPGLAARLFHAGATEVIAAGVVASPDRESEACTGRGPCSVGGASAPASDDRMAGCDAVRPAGDAPPQAPSPARHAERPLGHGGGDARAPIVACVSGRGGSGKTVLVASLATLAARWGLRAAVIDLDLMFGNLYRLMGVDDPLDLGGIIAGEGDVTSFEEAVESTAMRIAPGLTLWGPLREPERAELLSAPLERLLDTIATVADIVFVDTSVFWGDAVALAVSRCDRCLVVGGQGIDAGPSAARVVGLVLKMGVPSTRMTSVFMEPSDAGLVEDEALRFEMGASLRSRVRIAHGGDEVASIASHAHLSNVLAGSDPFATGVRSLASTLLRELGCRVTGADEREDAGHGRREGIRLPWRRREVDGA
ncbi:MAG: hypothetical protein SOU51_03640 [Collinsella sp.]|nr:hypothetical protein [Collinsella sp.]